MTTPSDNELPRDVEFWQDTYHRRANPVFLPLSIRQNRIEDIFADFLVSLRGQARGRSLAKNKVGTTAGKDKQFDVLLEAILSGNDRLELPHDEIKLDLVRRWLRTELVREERSTNRPGSGISIVPLHIAVAEYFGRDPRWPAYGDFLCEMLTAGRAVDTRFKLLQNLWQFFSQSQNDPLAAVLELSLTSATEEHDASQERIWESSARRMLVRCPEHARLFQKDVENVLRYSGVSRRTMLVWLYSLFAFYLATYFLRMAYAAEAVAESLSAALTGSQPSSRLCGRCGLQPEGDENSGARCSNPIKIVLGERNLDHARLFKRYPYYTSQLQIASSYFGKGQREIDASASLTETLSRLAAEATHSLDQVTAWFALLAETYPTEEDNQRRTKSKKRTGATDDSQRTKWRLSKADKEKTLELLNARRVSAFEAVALHLNFEDMARASNNVMEWQFYQALARDPVYGFAKGRGEELQYKLLDGILAALVHSHVAEVREDATVQSFERALADRGLIIDDAYSSDLLQSLINLGLVEDVADAGDAKHLTVLYRMEEE
jgi:hypothetical protein